MEKKYRIAEDGSTEVAVLVSRGYGAGWHSWGMPTEALFDPIIVEFIENNQHESDELDEYLEKKYLNGYFGGLSGLYVRWVKEGERFMIEEYDGSETLVCIKSIEWLTA